MAKMVNPHKFMSPEWYEWTHNTVLQVHEHFMAWTRTIEPGTGFVLEAGCGKTLWYYHQFLKSDKWKHYTGLDVSDDVIDHRKRVLPNDTLSYFRNSIEAFSSYEHEAKRPSVFDLVFSHAVIDHAPDPDKFIRKSIEASSKHVYIMSYRGYFPALAEHKIEKNATDGYYYNDISVPQVGRLLDGLGHKYELHEVPTGLPEPEIQSELHIIVEK